MEKRFHKKHYLSSGRQIGGYRHDLDILQIRGLLISPSSRFELLWRKESNKNIYHIGDLFFFNSYKEVYDKKGNHRFTLTPSGRGKNFTNVLIFEVDHSIPVKNSLFTLTDDGILSRHDLYTGDLLISTITCHSTDCKFKKMKWDIPEDRFYLKSILHTIPNDTFVTIACFSTEPYQLISKFRIKKSVFGKFKDVTIFEGVILFTFVGKDKFEIIKGYSLADLIQQNEEKVKTPIALESFSSHTALPNTHEITKIPQEIFSTITEEGFIEIGGEPMVCVTMRNREFHFEILHSGESAKIQERIPQVQDIEDDVLAFYDNDFKLMSKTPDQIIMFSQGACAVPYPEQSQPFRPIVQATLGQSAKRGSEKKRPPKKAGKEKTSSSHKATPGKEKDTLSKPTNAPAPRIKDVRREVDGSPILPLVAKGVSVRELGKIDLREGYHCQRYIYPVGFLSSKEFPSVTGENARTTYMSEIRQGEEGPEFCVWAIDNPEKIWKHMTPSGVWKLVLEDIKRKKGVSVSGPEQFGLSDLTVKLLIQELPDAEKCLNYQFEPFPDNFITRSQFLTLQTNNANEDYVANNSNFSKNTNNVNKIDSNQDNNNNLNNNNNNNNNNQNINTKNNNQNNNNNNQNNNNNNQNNNTKNIQNNNSTNNNQNNNTNQNINNNNNNQNSINHSGNNNQNSEIYNRDVNQRKNKKNGHQHDEKESSYTSENNKAEMNHILQLSAAALESNPQLVPNLGFLELIVEEEIQKEVQQQKEKEFLQNFSDIINQQVQPEGLATITPKPEQTPSAMPNPETLLEQLSQPQMVDTFGDPQNRFNEKLQVNFSMKPDLQVSDAFHQNAKSPTEEQLKSDSPANSEPNTGIVTNKEEKPSTNRMKEEIHDDAPVSTVVSVETTDGVDSLLLVAKRSKQEQSTNEKTLLVSSHPEYTLPPVEENENDLVNVANFRPVFVLNPSNPTLTCARAQPNEGGQSKQAMEPSYSLSGRPIKITHNMENTPHIRDSQYENELEIVTMSLDQTTWLYDNRTGSLLKKVPLALIEPSKGDETVILDRNLLIRLTSFRGTSKCCLEVYRLVE